MALSNTAVPIYYGKFRDAVIRGDIPICKEVEMEMQRIDSLIADPGIYYDDAAVEGFISYCENELTLTDGSDLNLLDSFKVWAEQIFGWYYFVERSIYEPYEDGHGGHYVTKWIKTRLVNKQYLIVARGAAKSMYASCLQNYFLDRLVFRGSEQSVIYQLNNISGALQAENVDTINGEVITPRTITADRIVAKAITATEINVQNLVATGLIEANRLTSKNIVVDDLFATDITAAGSIKSSNYVHTSGIYSTAGVKMSMATGQIISRQFAIDASGNTYFAGQLSAPTGNIGGFTIGTNSLYSGPDNLGSNKKGVYIGTDGISSIGDNGGKYVQIRNGKITGHNSGSMSGTSEAVIDLTAASSVGNRAFGLGAQAGLLSVYMIDETAINLSSAKGIIISYDGIYTGKYQSGMCVRNKTLLSVDGDVGCSLNLSNALWLRTYNTAGTLTRLIGMNSKDNVHMGDYNGDNISPVYIHAKGKQYNFTDAAFCPNVKNDVTLGGASKLWKTVYAKTGTINTSDRTKKHDIKDLTEVYEKLFLKLQPKSFIFNDGDRVHIGAISQDVEDAMHELGMSAEDFAGFCKDIQYDYREYNDDGTPVEESRYIITDADGNPVYDYALRYQDFIFLTIHMVQKLFIKIEKIENEMDAMKMKIAL